MKPARAFYGVECLLTVYMNLDTVWLLARFGDVERAGTSTREMGEPSIRNGAVFLTLSWTGTRGKTSKPPHFTKCGQEPTVFRKISG